MTDSKIDEYIKCRSKNDPDFANAVKKDSIKIRTSKKEYKQNDRSRHE